MPLIMAVTSYKKPHNGSSALREDPSYRTSPKSGNELWKFGQKLFLRYYAHFTYFHEKLSQRHRGQADEWTWYPHTAFFILLRTKGLTNFVLTEGAIQGSQGPCSHKLKVYL
jgi:hypothetical protein